MSSRRVDTYAIAAEIRRTLAVLFKPGEVVELRAPNSRRVTLSGYFTDFDTSLMPENFGEIISPADFDDLIAFLFAHGPKVDSK